MSEAAQLSFDDYIAERSAPLPESVRNWTPPSRKRNIGATYEPSRDGARLELQIVRVFNVMKDGKKRTLAELARESHTPEASASARFRDLKAQGLPMKDENCGSGLWVYWMDLRGN